ncbi:hypothetical protein [Erysipelothrix tonsillarum]|uniref:hypothetical protein n=1 Tax=Erysipelothrix tonsillarum TaxID=38402 RepID=UPI000380A189|nr:hypothetical protein [Erysipelothrix tonsillarum]
MKKIFPLAIIGAAIGAAGYYMNQNNKKHVEKTIETLDDISRSAEDTVSELAQEIDESEEA